MLTIDNAVATCSQRLCCSLQIPWNSETK